MSAIRLEGLRKHYGTVRALDGLDLEVSPGTVYGFLGPNGAGKTTTIRILAGLARPTAGRAWIAGEEVSPQDGRDEDFRHMIGYLPEEPAFYNWMTPSEYLSGLVAPLFGLSKKEALSRADELTNLVGLADVRRRRIGGFSRGMRQRLGLAQALVSRPRVLLLDEPVSALDPVGRHEILELIEGLRGEVTIFMSSHVLADVERVCDTVAIINRGRLVVQGNREELLARFATPTLEVEFEAGEVEVRSWASRVDGKGGVRGSALEGRLVRLTAADPERAKVEMPGLVAAAAMPVLKYEWVRPTLEDVFLRLVGPHPLAPTSDQRTSGEGG